jgi:outer membrane lipase/esterase
MSFGLHGLAIAAALAFATGASAATLPYSGLYAFGDSLTDNGNAYELSFGLAPESPPYFRGRFSNGPIWYDRVARKFRRQDLETRNFAVGGARALMNLDPSPDLRAQKKIFLDRIDPTSDSLAAIWIGANDLLPQVGRRGIGGVARAAADEVVDTAASLHRNGVGSALVFNLPNLADIPRYAGANKEKRRSATRGSVRFNDRLADGLADLRDDGMNVIEVDVFGIFSDVVANPGDYGVTNLTEPCLDDGRNRCSRAEARESAFFDNIHPSATLHKILAREVFDLLDPPPVMASLLDETSGQPSRTSVRAMRRDAATPVPVPLPATGSLALVALALLGVAGLRRPLSQIKHRMLGAALN